MRNMCQCNGFAKETGSDNLLFNDYKAGHLDCQDLDADVNEWLLGNCWGAAVLPKTAR